MTFDEFNRRRDGIDDDAIKANEFAPTAGNNNEATTTQQNRDQLIDVAKKLFASACRSKRKLYRTEPIDGPLYIDPHLNEKVKNPRKCKFELNFKLISFFCAKLMDFILLICSQQSQQILYESIQK